jgi:hypothetical protein
MTHGAHPQEHPLSGSWQETVSTRAVTQVRGAGGGWLDGGTEGNERLTVQSGAVLLVLLAALGVTIIRIGQLTWLHLFLGLVLIGPVTLKIASTGYRFGRYYTRNAAYTHKGPPALALRLLGPVVVLSTLGVFATGIVLLALGPGSRSTWLLFHKVFFFVWLAATAVHVLGHLPELRHGLLGARRTRAEVMAAATPAAQAPRPTLGSRISIAGYSLAARRPGSRGRAAALGGALLAGLILALALIPDFGSWVHHGSFHHH